MSKMLTAAQIAANLKANKWFPLVGVIDLDNCEWAYDAEVSHKFVGYPTRAFL